jgi:hypothetical protein
MRSFRRRRRWPGLARTRTVLSVVPVESTPGTRPQDPTVMANHPGLRGLPPRRPLQRIADLDGARKWAQR